MVEVVTRSQDGWVSSGRTEAKFAAVTGFECTDGNVSNVILQETVSRGSHSFPVGTIKENLTLNIQTNDKLFEQQKNGKKKSSYTQYVTPSYWMGSDDQKTKVLHTILLLWSEIIFCYFVTGGDPKN